MARTQRTVLDIFDVINGFCKYSCSDPRDHLFGLLGPIDRQSEGTKLSLKVDYSLSLEAIFLYFCYEMLESIPETDQLFDLLVMLSHAVGFEGAFYGGCAEDEVLEFFRGAAMEMPAEYDMLSGKRIFQANECHETRSLSPV